MTTSPGPGWTPDERPTTTTSARGPLLLVIAAGAIVVLVVVVLVTLLLVRPALERRADRAAVAEAYDSCQLSMTQGSSLERDEEVITLRSVGIERGASWTDVECVGSELGLPTELKERIRSATDGTTDEARWGSYYVLWIINGDRTQVSYYYDWNG